MRRLLGFAGCLLFLLGATPALAGTTPWMDGWVINGDLGITMLDADNVTTFAPNDPRLGPNTGNNGTTSGGMSFSALDEGNHYGGDNARVLMNKNIEVPAGEYYFEVDFDEMVWWDHNGTLPLPQAWGLAQEWYIGDSADMDYGNWPQGGDQGGGSPSGPWKGGNWGDNNYTKLGSMYNGSNQDPPELRSDQNGIWFHQTLTQTIDNPAVNTIYTDGTIIFRWLGRWKDNSAWRQSVAMDDLTITLTPVAGGDPIVYTDAFLPEPASMLLLLAGIPLLLRRRR